MTTGEIAGYLGAAFNGPDLPVDEISTDSREIGKNTLFLALIGERFDGNDYIDKAFSAGAVAAIASRPGSYAGETILVPDTGKALLTLAGAYRNRFTPKIVGVTGSVGKTTTKEMIAAVLSAQYRTLKTEGNFNNQIGMPKTLFRLDRSVEAVVLEMGMSSFGEIESLTQIARPDAAVITGIGVSHIEILGSRENILKAKLEITKGMRDASPLFVCGDNDLLANYQNERLRVVRYGIENPENQIRAENIVHNSTETTFKIVYNNYRFDARIPCVGKHNVLNALCAFAVGVEFKIPPQKAAAALMNYRPAGMRQKIVPFHDFTVVEDCYNASPDSMRAAIDTLCSMDCKRKILVLSDMLELGDIARESHYEIGAYAAHKGVDFLFCFGEYAAQYVKGASESGMQKCQHFDDKTELFAALKTSLSAGDVVWFKASRGMKLEEVINRVYEEC